MTNRKRMLAVLATALVVMALNVGATVVYMAFYGHVIAPDRDPAYYDAHVQAMAPWSSIFIGAPLMFFAGGWLARRIDGRHAVMIAVVYIAIDSAIIVAAGAFTQMLWFELASYSTKVVAAWLGARYARARWRRATGDVCAVR